MSAAIHLLSQLEMAGVALGIRDGRLHVRSPGQLLPEVRQGIRTHRRALLAELQGRIASPRIGTRTKREHENAPGKPTEARQPVEAPTLAPSPATASTALLRPSAALFGMADTDERAAVQCEADCLTADEARQRVALEHGFDSWATFAKWSTGHAAQRLGAWRPRSAQGRDLRQVALRFNARGDLLRAALAGWDVSLELLGVPSAGPDDDLNAMGLVPWLTEHGRGMTVGEFRPEGVQLTAIATGRRQQWFRFQTDPAQLIAMYDCEWL